MSKSEYWAAQDEYQGYCTECKALTRDETEPDATDYDCPQCGQPTVMGVEEALMEEKIKITGD